MNKSEKKDMRTRYKSIYKSILVMGLCVVSLTVSAQKDSTIIRQVMLERDYTPTIQEASKVNIPPDIYSPVIKAKEIRFISSTPQIVLNSNQLAASAPGDIKTNVSFDTKRGYAYFGAGTHGNLEGGLGYRLVNEERDRLDLFGSYTGTNSTIDYINGKNYAASDVTAKYSNTGVNLKYQHRFEPSILSVGTSFYNTSYNYYGNSFIPASSSIASPFDVASKQGVNVFKIGLGLKSSDDSDSVIEYDGSVDYNHFSNKYGLTSLEDGVKGSVINAAVNLFTGLGSDRTVGIKGSITTQSFGRKITYLENAYHGYTNITGTPYVRFDGDNWDADLGINLSALFDVKTAFAMSPNVKASVKVTDANRLYAEIGGGVNNNTFLDILQENRYVDPISRVDYSKTYYDAKIGFLSGAVSGLEFDLFAGYKHVRRDHLYVCGSHTDGWGNVGSPVYANISTGHIGGLLKTNLLPYTDLSARIMAYFYNVKYQDAYVPVVLSESLPAAQAWGRPKFTLELNADVKPFDNLLLSLNYLVAGGRKAVEKVYNSDSWEIVNMKSINELNFKAEYKFIDWLSANIRLNNILFQKYELQYGYPLQGFNILGGVNFRF
ncbi:MAG: TonB-dependent receptor [Prevotella sp.]|jgi:hypothetical protein|nr:TonB-dependent receptor [Prevotella sp.]